MYVFEQETRYAKDVPIRDKRDTHSSWMAFYSVYVKITSNMKRQREEAKRQQRQRKKNRQIRI